MSASAVPTPGAAITAEELRTIAEAAVGIPEGKMGYIARDGGGKLRLSMRPEGEVLLTVTGLGGGAWHFPDDFEVELHTELGTGTAGGGKVHKLKEGGYDACFWSRSAINKFVLPYYLPLLGPEKVVAMQNELATGRYVGVVHGQYSEPDFAAADGSIRHAFFAVPTQQGARLVDGAAGGVVPLTDLLG